MAEGERKSGGTVLRTVLGDRSETYAAACAETPDHTHPTRGSCSHKIVEDAVDHLLIEGGIVAERDEVIFETLCFNHFFRRQ